MEITDVLGRVRTVENVYPDGAWNCPFCWAAVSPERPCAGYAGGCAYAAHCPNPACYANPHFPVEVARAETADNERKKREEAERKANHDWAMKRAAEDRETRASAAREAVEEANRRGACANCALHSMRFGQAPRFVKHRGNCTLRK